jgi:LemA protein
MRSTLDSEEPAPARHLVWKPMKTVLILLLVAMMLGGLEAGNRYFSIRADLHAQREEAGEDWAQVDQALEHRAILISDLASKRGLGESTLIAVRDISDARKVLHSNSAPQEKLAANGRLSLVLSKLMTDANSNPKLQSDPAFTQWKDELAKCDNDVAVARSRYNRMLEKYNARIQEFPDSLVASMAGFHRDDAYFRTDEAADPKR